jgi:N-acetylmuramoyl-L-alanine amidase
MDKIWFAEKDVFRVSFMRGLLYSVLSLLYFSYALGQQSEKKLSIVQRPIKYDSLRVALSVEYLRDRHGLSQRTPSIVPRIIVVHHTGGGDLTSNFNYFNRSEIEKEREQNHKASRLNVSAHFLVDRDGTIYQLLNETLFARHTIGLNYCSIGIENIGGPHDPLTDAQAFANVKLIEYLCSKHKIEYLIGHSEYLRFRNTPLWKESDPKYINQKPDPGEKFMRKIRNSLVACKFKELPS